jgi:glycolate oxidase iron-sulfur subunit
VAAAVSRELPAVRQRCQSGPAVSPVFHAPCTLQHGLKSPGVVEQILAAAGAQLLPVADAHLCCGSAGSYALLQPQLAAELRTRKLAALTAAGPTEILSANIGCMAHLSGGTSLPVRHWIEWLDQRFESEGRQ